MNYLKEVPQGTVWPHLLTAMKDSAEQEVRDYARGRAGDVERGAETPALAALQVANFAWGVSKAMAIVGVDADVVRIADELVREIDPEFEANRKARWAATPAGLSFGS